MMTLAIELHDISVQYRLPREQLSGIKEFAIRWAQGRLRYHQFWALRGVDLMIERGESFGVIGRNG
ncbi:MAG: ABC transporter ATP-binding protein, partial [Anaerolineae bacterium]|nr:ABC transporter ATP-binding protein [Anaerolineae bacterium]